MIDRDVCQVMARYNRWMNERLYALCDGLEDDERRRDRGAFFGGIHATLDHIVYGDRAWLARFEGREDEMPTLGRLLHESWPELLRARRALDAEIEAWAAGIEPGWLAGPFRYRSQTDGIERTLPAWVLVVHLFNHQTHHRGQVTTLLSQLGLDPGVTDLPKLPGLADPAP